MVDASICERVFAICRELISMHIQTENFPNQRIALAQTLQNSVQFYVAIENNGYDPNHNFENALNAPPQELFTRLSDFFYIHCNRFEYNDLVSLFERVLRIRAA